MLSAAASVFLCTALTAPDSFSGNGAFWLDVPFVHQEKNGCGAASVAMLERYWKLHGWPGPVADTRQIERALYSPKEHGVRGSEVERYLRQSGFRTFVFSGEWRDLNENLANGRPLMVCLEQSRHGQGHYVIVVGLDPDARIVLFNDPARRKLFQIGTAEFEKDWKAAGNWTLLAVPRSTE